jgi:hypothetical protein
MEKGKCFEHNGNSALFGAVNHSLNIFSRCLYFACDISTCTKPSQALQLCGSAAVCG